MDRDAEVSGEREIDRQRKKKEKTSSGKAAVQSGGGTELVGRKGERRGKSLDRWE